MVRAQFTDAQWRDLSSFRQLRVVLPLSVPAGYRVIKVDTNHQPFQRNSSGGGYWPESYTVTYGDGAHTIEVDGSNWTAGGDPGPESYARYFHSPVFGTGVVSYGEGHKGSHCLLAYQLVHRPAGATFLEYLMEYRGQWYSVQSCDDRLAPADFIRMIESARPTR